MRPEKLVFINISRKLFKFWLNSFSVKQKHEKNVFHKQKNQNFLRIKSFWKIFPILMKIQNGQNGFRKLTKLAKLLQNLHPNFPESRKYFWETGIT